jgi:hypothetical protein
MNVWPDITWMNALRLIVDAFLLGIGWTAGCWLMSRVLPK